jgi:hypothetical protein
MNSAIKITTAALGFAVAQAFAQAPAPAAPEVPKHNCDPKPVYQPLKSDAEVKALSAKMAAYKDCFVAYIAERRAVVKANQAADEAAAKEYNEAINKFRADQEAAVAEQEAKKKADAKDNVSRPGAPAPKN